MKKEIIRKFVGIVLLVFTFSIGFYEPFQKWVMLPKEVVLFEGNTETIHHYPSTSAESKNDVVKVVKEEEAIKVAAMKQGEDTVTVTKGDMPIKKIDVTVLPKVKVVPGGQSIGVKLNTDGVLVVGHHLVNSEEGEKSPGELAGIKVGDTITKINGNKVESMNEVVKFVEEAGKKGEPLTLEIKRDNETFTKEIIPLKNKGDATYRLGLYIRDSAAGVGTLTFYDPETKIYGALGHVISDVDTKKPIAVHNGHIIRSSVTSIEKGSSGEPGEKLARFSEHRNILGTISKNSSFGIFGKLTTEEKLTNNIIDEPIPIALASQVKEGPAKILTVVEGEEVDEFDIEIVSNVPQKFPATKGLVIKITDPKLLKATGGIIQGMSGSPIIQDGKLVGAVTHVFVNDPTSGYGCHIEWMLEEAGIPVKSKMQEAS